MLFIHKRLSKEFNLFNLPIKLNPAYKLKTYATQGQSMHVSESFIQRFSKLISNFTEYLIMSTFIEAHKWALIL